MLQRLRYALFHGKLVLLVLLVLVFFVSSGIFDTVQQLNSAKNGIEVLLIDTMPSLGGTNQLAESIKKSTGVKYTGVGTLSTSDAKEYVATVNNYTLSDYFSYLAFSKNCEAIFVTEGMLPEVYKMDSLVPMNIEGTFSEICYRDGVLYAVPLKGAVITDFGSTVTALNGDAYAVLTDGDHTQIMRQYLKSIITEEK